jgi:hypothetical protein
MLRHGLKRIKGCGKTAPTPGDFDLLNERARAWGLSKHRSTFDERSTIETDF